VTRADVIASSLLAYVEVHSALSRLRRENKISGVALSSLIRRFRAGWAGFLTLEVDPPLADLAADLARRHVLSGADAVHLASALALRNRTSDAVDFSTNDRRLRTSAIAEGFVVT
jgi:uncharacterized protein